MILDLGFGERGLLDRRPHDRLRAAIELVAHGELHDLAGDLRFRVVATWSGTGSSQSPSTPRRLNSSRCTSIHFSAKARHSRRNSTIGHIVLVLALGAILLLDLPLDRQAVAVPARHVVGIEAEHALRADDQVLQDLVERMADMDVAVGIGRAVVQHEARTALLDLAQALVELVLVPALQELRLALRQAGPHGELGLGQEQGFGIVAGGALRLIGHDGQSVLCGPQVRRAHQASVRGERLGSRTFAGHAKAGPIIRAAPMRAASRS